MPTTLEEAKKIVRAEFLGVAGIHGVGLRRADNAVCIYVHQGEDTRPKDLTAVIEGRVQPYRLIVIEEPAPQMLAPGADQK
ncbi:MAG: hypothetical protein ACR2RL_22985 [Gammaproteobacteria bacterium]